MQIKKQLPFYMASTALLSACGTSPQESKQQPNIVFIIADDLGYADIGCYGQKLIKTPNIDKMASEGMRFTQHYAGCSVSAPSRSSLLTGLHTGHTPIRGNKEIEPEGQEPHPTGTYTMARMLHDNGYATGCFGKWGLGYPNSEGTPDKQGFDEFFGYNCQRMAHNYYPYYLWHNNDTVWLKGNEGTKTEDYASDIIHQQGLNFIRSNKDKPFFALMTYVIPHAELLSPKDSIMELYQNKFPETPYVGIDSGEFYKRGGYGSTPQPKAEFATMITRLDTYVGEILATLKELGIDENTVVFFTSDNGPHREGGADPDFFNSYGEFRGVKRDFYEGGIRIPMIVRWNNHIQAGTESEHMAAFWDIMPTFADIANCDVEGPCDGISYLPTLLNQPEKQQEHAHLYWEYHSDGGYDKICVRKGDWKAIWIDPRNPEHCYAELYNLAEDIHEDNNLAEAHPEIVAELLEVARNEHQENPVFPFRIP